MSEPISTKQHLLFVDSMPFKTIVFFIEGPPTVRMKIEQGQMEWNVDSHRNTFD